MFKENDYVVYRKSVCKVKQIKNNERLNSACYILVPVNDESLKIEVPVSKGNDYLRNLISIDKLEEIIKAIPNIDIIDDNDKLIENEYKELLKRGNHEDLIKIIKTTYLRNKERTENKKKISDKDKNYFEQAEKYLYTEFSIVLGKGFDETKKYIEDKVGSIVK